MTDDRDDTQVNRVDPTVRQPAIRGFSAPDLAVEAGRAGEGRDSAVDAEAPVERHSALVGWMSVPVHQRLPIRRSTLLMIILFLGFGTLCYLYPPNSGAITCDLASGTCSGPAVTFPVPSSATSTTTSTTAPATTTTTVRPTTSTTSGGHAGSSTSTTAAGQPAPTTTAPTTPSTSTTQPRTSGSTTTSSAPGGSGTGTTTTVPRP